MSWFMDPVPDGGTVHAVGTALRGAQSPYATQIQTVQNAHDQTVVVWQGNDSDAHSQTTATTQQIAQQQSGWTVAIADTLNVLGTILQIIFTLQMAWMAIQLATAVWAIFTAGLDALVTEGPAAALAVAIQGLKDLVVTLLQGFVKALLSPATRAGAIIGGLAGLGVGINTVEQQHLSGWDAFLTIIGDTGQGAYTGGSIGMMFAGIGDPSPGISDPQSTGTVWDRITPTDDVRPDTNVPRSFELQVGDDTYNVHPNATKHMEEFLLRDGTSPWNVDIRSQSILKSFVSAVDAAVPQLGPGRNFLVVGDWELGIDTSDNVIYHARMLTH
jgi:hypothetical protein